MGVPDFRKELESALRASVLKRKPTSLSSFETLSLILVRFPKDTKITQLGYVFRTEVRLPLGKNLKRLCADDPQVNDFGGSCGIDGFRLILNPKKLLSQISEKAHPSSLLQRP